MISIETLFKIQSEVAQDLANQVDASRLDMRSLTTILALVKTKALYQVFLVAELRESIFTHLSPGEVLVFCSEALPIFSRRDVSDWLSPLRLVFPDIIWLSQQSLQGYNFTLVSEHRHMLLNHPSDNAAISQHHAKPYQRSISYQWPSILLITRRGKVVSLEEHCELINNSGVQLLDDTLYLFENSTGESHYARAVEFMDEWKTIVYIPLCSPPGANTIMLPGRAFDSKYNQRAKTFSKLPPKLFYHHFRDPKFGIHGPVTHREKNYAESTVNRGSITLEACLPHKKSNRTFLFDIESPMDESQVSGETYEGNTESSAGTNEACATCQKFRQPDIYFDGYAES